MAESVEQNGVKFTPEKVVNLDELMNQNKPVADGSGEIKEEAPEPEADKAQQDNASESENVESKSDQPDSSSSNTKDIQESGNNDADNIPLDELYLSVGDKEMNASQLVDEYGKISEELTKIKSDEFLSRFIDFYQGGGDPSEFLQKATLKWDNVSDVDLLRMKFYEENSDLEGDARDILFERELLNKYSINPDGTFDDEDSREAKLGRQLIKRDASKLRSSKIEEQKSFLLPQKKDESQQQSYDPEKYKQELLNDQELKSFVSKKSLPVGEGLSYEVKNPDKVIGMMANVGEFWQLFQKPDGGWDKTGLAKVFAFALDPKSYDDHILRLGQDMGSESYLKEQRNTVQKGRVNVVDKSTDMDTVSVRDGRIIGTNKEDLLKAFIAQKRK